MIREETAGTHARGVTSNTQENNVEPTHFQELTDEQLECVAGGDGLNIVGSIVGSWFEAAAELSTATGAFWSGAFKAIGALWDWG